MKPLTVVLLVLGMLACQPALASAATCVKGVHHAGCVGPHGAVVVKHPVVHCYWRAGVKVCH